ncbi:unnamed protein product [Rotaria socialis]|uniref:Glycolipid transfer protein domain-containing protein n=1 Tax=Rotaria socialis TaxID=392032 RepID=A0A817KK50_9BILA|nr:unnamed protein product [Rotaria socialis]CAF3255018.1 unnamed protein product [Rotaria socialis]CAF3306368.1 unnamed protein product [Rotaria socialis]CAF4088550.1 unnamed protein product [Rotaria socialis]CAF4541590.1 unnamed protein product [Rotaria socialis]
MDAIIPVDTPEINGTALNQPFRLRTDSITRSSSIGEREPQSVDIIEPVVRTTYSSSGGFDVQSVYQSFITALKESQNPKSPIGTQEYINGYRELSKFFDQLGIVFKFVKDDVVQKLTILQDFVDKDKGDIKHFDTIQKAIDYETANNLIKTNSNNFARTLLRLHRALIFIEEFLRGLSDRPASDSTAAIAASAYDSTLYHHHGFLIRTTVKVGFHALPSRKQLEEVIFHGHKSEMIEQYKIFIKTIKQIYDSIEIYYAEKNYLQLP